MKSHEIPWFQTINQKVIIVHQLIVTYLLQFPCGAVRNLRRSLDDETRGGGHQKQEACGQPRDTAIRAWLLKHAHGKFRNILG